jgi:hypothetical protein
VIIKTTFMLIDIAISGDKNVLKKESEKIPRHEISIKQKYSACGT